MRVLITRPIYPESVARLRAAGLEVVERSLSSGSGDIVEAVQGADVVVSHLTDRIDRALFAANQQVRLVSNVAAGFDNIDLFAAADAGVRVTNTPGVLTDVTADLAVGLMLAVARRIPESEALVRRDRRVEWSLKQEPMGVAVSGQTLGIVGMGRIGWAVAQRAMNGLRMRILFTGGSGGPARDAAEAGAVEVSLNTLFAESDFVSLHAPFSDATYHLVDAKSLAAMKPGAILINTARGSLVDEAALAAALADGVIFGAGIDVFEHEPEVHPALLELRERVVLTSHIGSATESTRRAMSDMAVDNVLAFVAGSNVPNPVPLPLPNTEVVRGRG